MHAYSICSNARFFTHYHSHWVWWEYAWYFLLFVNSGIVCSSYLSMIISFKNDSIQHRELEVFLNISINTHHARETIEVGYLPLDNDLGNVLSLCFEKAAVFFLRQTSSWNDTCSFTNVSIESTIPYYFFRLKSVLVNVVHCSFIIEKRGNRDALTWNGDTTVIIEMRVNEKNWTTLCDIDRNE